VHADHTRRKEQQSELAQTLTNGAGLTFAFLANVNPAAAEWRGCKLSDTILSNAKSQLQGGCMRYDARVVRTHVVRRARGLRPLVFCCLVACASTHGAQQPGAGNRNVIREAEIRAANASDVYQLVRERRPQWFSTRGPTSLRTQLPLAVYVEGVRSGSIEALHDYQLNDVVELRYLSGPEATQLYGTNNAAGAIQVFLRRGR
jgi:hypothetical protein